MQQTMHTDSALGAPQGGGGAINSGRIHIKHSQANLAPDLPVAFPTRRADSSLNHKPGEVRTSQASGLCAER